MRGAASVRRLLRYRDFRLLWLARSASEIGDNLVLVALGLFVVKLTGSATDLGLVLAAHMLPFAGLLLFGGVWADRLPRHQVIVATDTARFLLRGLLTALIFAGVVRVWELVAIEMLSGAAEAFCRPAINGLLPQTVPEEEIQEATALSSTSTNVAQFAGPALATALVLGAGAGWAFGLDAATFGLSAVLAARMRPRRRRTATPAEASESGGVFTELRAGYREVRSRPWLWVTLVCFCAALFCGDAPLIVLGPLVARQQYGHLGIYGIVATALGLGTVVGSIAALGWRPRFPMRLGMLAIMLWPLADILFAAGVPLAGTIVAMLVGGAGTALFDVWWMTALAEQIPPEKLSRVSSYDWMVSLALLPLGYLLVGPLASALGSVAVLLGGSALALVAFAVGLIPRDTRMLEARARDEAVAMLDEPRARVVQHGQ